MRKSKIALWMALVIATGPVAAQNEDNWVSIAETADSSHAYYGRKGSFELTTNKAGESIAIINGQVIPKKKGDPIKYNRWYVTTSDCDAGMGKLVTLTVSSKFEFETDFVTGGTSVASYLAGFICDIHKRQKAAQDLKGV